MPGLIITTSPNVSFFDSKIIGSVCDKKFYIDATPSVFIGSGASNVLGVRVKITNPYGVIIKDYGAGYDIAAPLTAIYERAIPTQAGTVQYGVYTVTLQLTDADSVTYEVTKTINICTYNEDQNPCDDRLRLIASCKNGTLTVSLSEPPVFKGILSQSRTQTVVVKYPTGTLAPLTSANGSFSVQLFPGVYIVDVDVCATYNFTDNVFLELPYEVTKEKNVKCVLDYTCIWPRIKQLWDNIGTNCSQADKDKYSSIALEACLLLHTAELANDSGEDASDYIDKLEKLLGCECTCDCSGSPIVNGSPATNILIEGCNVTTTVVDLTTVYTINNYSYLVSVDPAQSVITISAPALTDCVMSQQLSFSISAMYAGIKTQIGDITEYNYWASVIDNVLDPLDASCLGYSASQWAALTFAQKIAAIIATACEGGTCTASVAGASTDQAGSDVVLSWTQTGGYKTDIYIDGILVATVLISVDEFTIVGGADGNNHTYLIVPICTNGSNGTTATGTYNYLGCPTVTPPVVSSNSVTDAECPYDLTSLLATPPVGITVEWHTANNTLAGTLVPDATAVSGGIYYAFSKDADGCYSSATSVTIICESATSCTAPQSLTVTEVSGDFRIAFNSAANPPPANSYTVKRRLASAPDVDGSYTTIGTPIWNAGLAKWVITDTTGLDNTLYVYKAISNCGGSPATTPFATYTFANITCPSVTLTPGTDEVGYSFSNVGGEVDKYEVKIYDETGLTLIHTDTILPAFSSPITGTFIYLTSGTAYKVQVTVYIGTQSQVCTMIDVITEDEENQVLASNTAAGRTITAITGIAGFTLSGSLSTGEEEQGTHTAFTGVITVSIIGAATNCSMLLYVNGGLDECVNVTTANDYVFASGTYSLTDSIEIILNTGSCS